MDEQKELTFEMELDGEKRICTVLFTFYSDQTKADYMLYTPDNPEGTEQIRVMAGRFNPEDLSAIYPLQDDTDRQLVQQFLEYMVNAPQDEQEEPEEDDGIRNVEDL